MKIPVYMNEEYFANRSMNFKWTALTKRQSKPITHEEKEQMVKYIEEKVELNIPPEFDPDFWGGFIIVPYKIEFWEADEFSIHDRQVFTLEGGMTVSYTHLTLPTTPYV